jgi:hypothetical protein
MRRKATNLLAPLVPPLAALATPLALTHRSPAFLAVLAGAYGVGTLCVIKSRQSKVIDELRALSEAANTRYAAVTLFWARLVFAVLYLSAIFCAWYIILSYRQYGRGASQRLRAVPAT